MKIPHQGEGSWVGRGGSVVGFGALVDLLHFMAPALPATEPFRKPLDFPMPVTTVWQTFIFTRGR